MLKWIQLALLVIFLQIYFNTQTRCIQYAKRCNYVSVTSIVVLICTEFNHIVNDLNSTVQVVHSLVYFSFLEDFFLGLSNLEFG